jgi:hypothetical protein
MHWLSQVRLQTSSPFAFNDATSILPVSTTLLMVFGPSSLSWSFPRRPFRGKCFQPRLGLSAGGSFLGGGGGVLGFGAGCCGGFWLVGGVTGLLCGFGVDG